MTDRIHSLTVVLEKDMRDDDVEGLILAIGWFKHVISVKAHVADYNANMAEERARRLLREKLMDLIRCE